MYPGLKIYMYVHMYLRNSLDFEVWTQPLKVMTIKIRKMKSQSAVPFLLSLRALADNNETKVFGNDESPKLVDL